MTQLVTMLGIFGLLTLSQTPKIDKVKEPVESIYDIEINTLDGNPFDLNSLKGKKILFVNVASKCGFTKQYKDLQALHEQFDDKVSIIGVPCNQFGGQEPGTSEEIQSFCEKNFGVTFQLLEKVKVKGKEQHPLYQWLTQEAKNGNVDSAVKWNFQKYLIDEEGRLLDVFSSKVNPMDEEITSKL